MIVAVTGANGFIGRHLTSALARRGHEARAIVRADMAGGRLPDLLAGADVVIHAAAATRAPTHEALRRSNVELTGDVLDAARTARVGRFVFISSQAAAGPATSRARPVREDDAPVPIDEYGRTKLAAERIVSASGLPFTIVRPAAVYGPGDRDFAVLFRLARLGIAIHPGNRAQWISLLHVDDCVAGIIATADSTAAIGRTYFLANDEPVQWGTLFAMARDAMGAAAVIDVEIPRAIVAVAALAGDVAGRVTGRASLLSTDKVALAVPRFWICSNARARVELDFRPRVELALGFAATAAGSTVNGTDG